MGRLVTKIGSGIGLVSEAIASRKSSKSSNPVSPVSTQETTRIPLSPYAEVPVDYRDSSERPPNGQHGVDPNANETGEHLENDKKPREIVQDEDQWALDNAASSQGADETDNKQSSNEMADVFLKNHPPPSITLDCAHAQLPCPVILPQRRPGDRKRGFILAYAPVLEDCGIDQATFLDFLQTFQASCQASPALRVVNIAAIGVGLVPGPISKGVSAATRVTVAVAMEAQRKSKTTSFLDRMNKEFFEPRNLYCLVMTYKPDSNSPSEVIDTSEPPSSKSDSSSPGVLQTFANMHSSSGATHGELELPEAAPLIFSIAGECEASATEEAPKKENGFKSSKNFASEYFDRRGRAKYAGDNPDSKLATKSDEPFKTRYGDPNSAANSGSISALLTGGALDLKKRRQERRNRGRAMVGLEPKEKRPQRKGPVRRLLKKDILYLMIVTLPSDAELRAVSEHDEKAPLES